VILAVCRFYLSVVFVLVLPSRSSVIMSSVPNLSQLITCKSVFYLNATHPRDDSHLCSLKCHLISFLTGHVSLPYNLLLHTQLLYNLPVIINDTSLLVSNGTNCLNLFTPDLHWHQYLHWCNLHGLPDSGNL